MAKIRTAAELAKACENAARNFKTLYVHGCFGAPMTDANKAYYITNTYYNRQNSRQAMIKAATPDTFGFDCVCLIKGILWGWIGDAKQAYGGAVYRSNGIPDINADMMIAECRDVSTDFSHIEVGEALWMSGHIGIYIGNGLGVECTPAWKNCVQITAVNAPKMGYYRRDWTKHGKLPWVTYSSAEKPVATGYKPAVGDIVTFTGRKHYANAWSGSALPCRPGRAKITALCTAKGAKRKVHLQFIPGGGSDVFGWVDEGTYTKYTSSTK